jgi:hypothetical protein
MQPTYQFSRVDLVFVIVSTMVFGGCTTLMLLGKLNPPLVLLTIGSFSVLISKVGKAYCRPRKSGGVTDHEGTD